MSKKAVSFVIISSLILGALGSWIWQRYIIPELNTVPFLVHYNLAPKAGPVVINTIQQIRVNEGSDTVAAIQTVEPWTVAVLSGGRVVAGGLILTSDGIIATTKAAVTGANTSTATAPGALAVKFTDGSVAPAALAASDPASALLLLKISSKSGLPTANFGDPAELQLSQRMIGLIPTLGEQQANAAVSYLSQTLNSVNYSEIYSADILSQRTFLVDGSQNWPEGTIVLSADGLVQGIDSASAIIPAGIIQSGLRSYFDNNNKIVRNSVGINYQYISKAQAQLSSGKQGIVLKSNGKIPAVILGGPAAKAGLQQDDLIYAVGGTQIDVNNNFENLIGQYKPGDSVRLSIQRGKDLTTFNLTIGAQQ